MLTRCLLLLLLGGFLLGADDEVLLFTYFRGNGEKGMNLATSEDGLAFTPLNEDRPVLEPPPWQGQNLVRDTSIRYHEGWFHAVWTTGWRGRVFGYAKSRDLRTWTDHRQVMPFPTDTPAEDQPENVWAPELHWDPSSKSFVILFASTTRRERLDEDASNNDGRIGSKYDNRVYVTRTTDFITSTPARVFYACDFASIDAVMAFDADHDRWAMVIKCSRNEDLSRMPGRNLWLSFLGRDLETPVFGPLIGPIAGNHAPMFSNVQPRKSMAEGPSLLRYRDRWLLVWDEPAGDGLQLATSPDLQQWTHQRQATLPSHGLHGSLFLAPRQAVAWLKTP